MFQRTDPSPGALAARVSAAGTIVREAGALAHDYFARRATLAVETKSGQQDLVSVADRAVESLIREAVLARFADDGLVGEEHGRRAGTSGFEWLIDPIDGTSCFLHGLRSWCVAVALVHAGRAVAGLVYDPCADHLYVAQAGRGAFCGKSRLAVDAATPFSGGLIAVGSSRAAHAAHVGSVIAGVMRAGGVYMRNGSAALTLAHVAAGHYLGYYERVLNAWDCMAGMLLVREAGGTVAGWEAGDVLAARPCIAAAPQAVATLRGIVAASSD